MGNYTDKNHNVLLFLYNVLNFVNFNISSFTKERPSCKRLAVQLGVYVVQTLDQLCFIPKHVVQARAAALELFNIPFTVLRLRCRFEPQ